MKIGVIGAGNVGGTLGKRFASAGHQVVFGSREPGAEKTQKLVRDAGKAASAATLPEAARAEVILLATPWPATQEILAGLGDLSGRVLIDVVNPVLPDLSGLALGTNTSAGEQVAQWAKGAKVVKAFNTVGFNIMADPNLNGKKALLFFCGDDAAAKNTVKGLATDIGFDAEDAGPLRQARLLEPLAMLWISLAFAPGHGREFAFQKIVRA